MALLRLLALLVATIAAAQARVTPIEEPFLPAGICNCSCSRHSVVNFLQTTALERDEMKSLEMSV